MKAYTAIRRGLKDAVAYSKGRRSKGVAHHSLKTWPKPFAALKRGTKRFEFRKNDRGFRVGDVLCLCEYLPRARRFTGRDLAFRVTYILRSGFGLPKGYVVMSLEEP